MAFISTTVKSPTPKTLLSFTRLHLWNLKISRLIYYHTFFLLFSLNHLPQFYCFNQFVNLHLYTHLKIPNFLSVYTLPWCRNITSENLHIHYLYLKTKQNKTTYTRGLQTELKLSQLQFSLAESLSRVRLCNPTNHSMPAPPVHHQHQEFTQTHAHRVGDAIQPSHPVIPFSSCPQSLPASGSFPMSQLFAGDGQSSGVSASASVFPMNTLDWSPLGCLL